MIRFTHPEAFLLGLVLLVVLRRRFLGGGRLVTGLRALLLLALLALLADPWLEGRAPGRDLVFLVDRSRSMPADGIGVAEELHRLAREQAGADDRIGVVTFGRDAVVESPPRRGGAWHAPRGDVDPDATDLAGAIETALALLPPGSAASVLVVSDGESTGRDPATAARDALRRGVSIDVKHVSRTGVFDLAIEDVAVPPEVAEGEPFQVTLWIRSDRAVEAPVTVRRDGRLLAHGTRRLRRGLNAVRFRDLHRVAGVHEYEVEVRSEGDRIAENNRARAAIRVTGPFRILVVTPGGREDRFTKSLEAAGIEVLVRAPEDAPLTDEALDGYRAVVLENVPLADLPPAAPRVLRRYVRDFGGGLLMTGGRASFGMGGYYRSPIEEVLPVSMEVRQEQRRFHLAMSIALDRSGSMAMSTASGATKMDLANRGACAAVELLGPGDGVAVTAVDSVAHEVLPLTDVTDRGGICARIRTIESMGGGIFVNTALRAAAWQLKGAPQGTRHIVLFADAADAEEPGDYKTLVPELRAAGVTVSVIGLGDDTDVDAAFLRDVASLGGGRCFFASDAADLPRVFAQETIQVARSSMVEEPVDVRTQPDLVSLGAMALGSFPRVGGYSIAYLEPEARRGLLTVDDVGAPLLSFWQHGLGRSAAYLGEVDGTFSGEVATWDGYADFFATLVRWLAGTEASDAVFATLERRGHEAVLSVEVAAGDETLLAGVEARVVGPDGVAKDVMLVQAGESRLEGRVSLSKEGVYQPVLRLADGRVLRMPPAVLPYSPEFEPRSDPAYGEKMLLRVARISGGRFGPPSNALFPSSVSTRGRTNLTPLVAWAALAFLLLEIAARRLHLRVPIARIATVTRSVGARALRPARRRPRARKRVPDPAPEDGEEAGPASESAPTDESGTQSPNLRSVLERAKRRRRRP